MTDQPQAPGPPPDDHSGDHSETTRRPRTRHRVPCPTCGKRMRENNLARHKERWHPELEIPALEAPNYRVSVRGKTTYSGLTCPTCREVIPAGTPLAVLVRTGKRSAPYAHVACRTAERSAGAAGGVPPPDPTQKETPLSLTLALPGSGPTPPTPRPAPTTSPRQPTTTGDALLTPEQLADLGIRSVKVQGSKHVVLELRGDRAREVVERLVGSDYADLVPCRTCRDVLGTELMVPRSQLQAHDLQQHADLWHRGRNLAEAAAIRDRAEKVREAESTFPDPPRTEPSREALEQERWLEGRMQQILALGERRARERRSP